MTMAANLNEAAALSADQVGILWNSGPGVLRAKYTAFLNTCNPLFDDNVPNERPCGNWMVPMYALLSDFVASAPETHPFTEAVTQYLYRFCWACVRLLSQGLITNAQATAVLNAWNAQIGT